MTPQEFLTELWGEKPEGWVLLWTAQNKRSTWFKSFHAVNNWVNTYRKEMDIYTGVSLAPDTDRPPSDRGRVSSAQSAGIPGLWADIDVAGPEHQRSNLPESIDAAMDALSKLEYEPSIIVHSGHGLQCWWLFEKPLVFQTEQDRHYAQQLTWRWHDKLATEWLKYGWHLDSTFDLARVLRLPGTINHKGAPVKVEVIQISTFRWKELPKLPSSSAQFSLPTITAKPAEVEGLNLNPELALSPYRQRQLSLAKEAIKQFADTLEHNRQFKDLDVSASTYDMSIAHYCIELGFSDQDTAIAIMQWRKQHGYDLKLRQDYYQRTIGKVRASHAQTT